MTREELAQYSIDNPMESPAFQLYPKDWFGSGNVAVMSATERGIHATLIMAAWLSPVCGLSLDRLHAQARVDERTFNECSTVVRVCWFEYAGMLFNERLLKERKKQIEARIQRSLAGKSSGVSRSKRTKKNKRSFSLNETRTKTNGTAIEIAIEKEDGITSWKDSFQSYLDDANKAFQDILSDREWIEEREKYHPNLDIRLSIEKAWKDYWLTLAGWKKKKASKSDQIDWRKTASNALDLSCNKVWKQRNNTGQFGATTVTREATQELMQEVFGGK